GKYRERALGAMGGIYGNDVEETFYAAYPVDADGAPLDAGRHRYTLTFAPGGLPPVGAFWSITMYDARSRLMVENPLGRYLINSAMLSRLRRDPDGGITLHLQHDSPGRDREPNWLPAPAGPMNPVLRMYLPKPEVVAGRWTPPPIVKVAEPTP
ncbi:MAG TPA: DUF1214 domain-containing protein, partial [Gemmatimonadales bacterium]|nr:DUF1214 domain-containing protein [Gemmatimonadales bacterium]